MYRRPQPRKYFFFEQSILGQGFGQRLFKLRRLTAQILNFIAISFTRRVACQALLVSLQKLLRSTVIQVLVGAFLAAQLGDAGFISKTLQHDPDLFLCSISPARRPADVSYRFFSTVILRRHHRSSSK
jgi:hypothetical protein